MTDKISVKLSDEGIEFLKKFRTNRRKLDIDEADLYYWKLFEMMVKYFKLNNDRYLELVNLTEEKDVF